MTMGLSSDKPLGTEQITVDDILMPRLRLAQSMTKELNKQEDVYIKDLGVGDFWNTVTEQNYGPGPITFSVLVWYPPYAVEYSPEVGGGIIDANVPLNDPRLEWVGNQKPRATKFADYLIWLHDTKEVIQMHLTRSAANGKRPPSKKLNYLIRLNHAPIYMGRYQLTSVHKRTVKDNEDFPHESWKFSNHPEGNNTQEQVVEDGLIDLHHSFKVSNSTLLIENE